MTVDCFAAESTVWMVAHYIDDGCEDYSVEAAASKVFASEAMQRTAYEALQIAGGNGFMREFPYEQVARDCRILPIFEGTNEILRLYIALSGLKACRRVAVGAEGGGELDLQRTHQGFRRAERICRTALHAGHGLGRDRIMRRLAPPLRPLARVYEKYVTELARVTDESLRKHGKAIADHQLLQKRIADLIIDLFVGLCVLSRADSIARADLGAAGHGVLDRECIHAPGAPAHESQHARLRTQRRRDLGGYRGRSDRARAIPVGCDLARGSATLRAPNASQRH